MTHLGGWRPRGNGASLARFDPPIARLAAPGAGTSLVVSSGMVSKRACAPAKVPTTASLPHATTRRMAAHELAGLLEIATKLAYPPSSNLACGEEGRYGSSPAFERAFEEQVATRGAGPYQLAGIASNGK